MVPPGRYPHSIAVTRQPWRPYCRVVKRLRIRSPVTQHHNLWFLLRGRVGATEDAFQVIHTLAPQSIAWESYRPPAPRLVTVLAFPWPHTHCTPEFLMECKMPSGCFQQLHRTDVLYHPHSHTFMSFLALRILAWKSRKPGLVIYLKWSCRPSDISNCFYRTSFFI